MMKKLFFNKLDNLKLVISTTISINIKGLIDTKMIVDNKIDVFIFYFKLDKILLFYIQFR